MDKIEFLHYLADEIKSVVVATVDSDTKPATMVLDILDADDTGIYFLTFIGKGLYNRLSANKYISITGMKGDSPSSMVAITIRGEAEETGREKLGELLTKNQEIAAMFPNGKASDNVTVFRVFNGIGEWIDTSKGSFDRQLFEI